MSAILALAGSNSSTSINFKLVQYTAGLIGDKEVQLLNMANYPFPLYSEDNEREMGFSNSLVELRDDIMKAKGVIISLNEHNSNPSAYFKNVLDWLSRLEIKFLEDTEVLLMSTSPGKRGGLGSLEIIEKLLPRFGANVGASFSLPSFYENFDSEKGITDSALAETHQRVLTEFLSKI
ncbi:NAD(P)H-dependent oxidoreductase [uncultured Eudoraea sp.]|uniref:NADPH-dependent FMN reductase n=1 Tax=uncultured Eudoraea sp. TaxID=1035614 RepID=UPI0026300C3F|nr:NAD(P)H-dependent oxidoreductase [uncultured Eudoraea sp.]